MRSLKAVLIKSDSLLPFDFVRQPTQQTTHWAYVGLMLAHRLPRVYITSLETTERAEFQIENSHVLFLV